MLHLLIHHLFLSHQGPCSLPSTSNSFFFSIPLPMATGCVLDLMHFYWLKLSCQFFVFNSSPFNKPSVLRRNDDPVPFFCSLESLGRLPLMLRLEACGPHSSLLAQAHRHWSAVLKSSHTRIKGACCLTWICHLGFSYTECPTFFLSVMWGDGN